MATFEVNYDLSLKDLLGVLFKRKQCPTCGLRLQRRWETKDGSGWGMDRRGLNFDFGYRNKTTKRLFYDCAVCESSCLPRDL